MTSDKRVYSKKVMEGMDAPGSGAPTADFSLPPPGKNKDQLKLLLSCIAIYLFLIHL